MCHDFYIIIINNIYVISLISFFFRIPGILWYTVLSKLVVVTTFNFF
jgi:uncharacterized protein YqfA (UPF0365 family)